MGLLDIFDSPDILASILGANGVTPSGAPTPPGMPSNPPSFSSPYSLNPAASASASPSPVPPQGAQPLPPGSVPLPVPRPALADGAPALPPPVSVGSPAPIAPPSAGAMPPPAPAPNMPQSYGGVGGLSAALGANAAMVPQPPAPASPLRSAIAGLGKGMSAVGALPRGANAGQAFAAGMGGGITGGLDYEEAQKKQLFDQSSTAFRDMLAAKNQDDTEGYRQAQSNYLNARANAMRTGGTGSGAYQNTPYWKTMTIEKYVKDEQAKQQTLLAQRWRLNGTSPEQQQQDIDQMQKNVEDYRQRLYKSAGIDPNQGEKLINMGTSRDNPFDTKGMSLDQFNTQVPMGAWYKDQNGTLRQRTVPPGTQFNNAPGGSSAPVAGQPQQSSAASPQPTYDDYQAMAPAA